MKKTKEKEIKKNIALSKGIIFDVCVKCGAETKEPHDKPIDERNYYITGSGQLCASCYFEIFGKINDDK